MPFSIGLLAAYCKSIRKISENFDFKEFIYLRDDPEKLAKGLGNPAVVGISCYSWNWEWSKAFARNVRNCHPTCLIIMGGPQVPDNSEDFFQVHPYVDIIVHNEGEVTFAEFLLEFLKEAKCFKKVNGISIRTVDNRCHRTPKRDRVVDVNVLPSPYLSGIFDHLIKLPYEWNVSQETHRGCPYQCSFCNLGSAVYSRVGVFKDDRLKKEFEWFATNSVLYLYNCDSNYGLLPRDFALTRSMVNVKKKYGYPKMFRTAWSKNSNQKVLQLAKMLNEAGMSKGVTLAFQSMNAQTLEAINRTNIRITDFTNLMKLYRSHGIPTYSEVIMGLPLETYDSYVEGIDTLLRSGQHDGLNCYPCQILSNVEMANPAYREKYGIKTVVTPLLWLRSTPSKDEITEYAEYIVETNTMPREDWKKVYLFSWAVQCFHCLGLTQCLSIFLHAEFNLPYRTFYERLLQFAKEHPNTLLGKEWSLTSVIVDKALQGGHWEVVIPKFGNITWPTEEASFLKFACEKDRFCQEIKDFIRLLIQEIRPGVLAESDEELIDDLLVWQKNVIPDPYSPKEVVFSLRKNLKDYFQKAYFGERINLVKGEHRLSSCARDEYSGDLELFARNVVWYGRKGGKMLRDVLEEDLSGG